MTAVGTLPTTIATTATMKAIVNDRYGSPDIMRLAEIEKPTPTADQVLVRVRASSVNALDWHILRADPFVARMGEGWLRPREHVRGVDVAGVVEAVGANVSHVKVGDAVFGSRTGAFAEFVAGRVFVQKPANLTFEQAAAIPTAGFTALQALRRKGQVKPGERVLVTGAGGGVGTFAVQIAKALGAAVTAVTRTENLEMVRALGADHVLDYTREDVTKSGLTFDLICDVAGYDPMAGLGRLLAKESGRLVVVGGGNGHGMTPLVRMAGAAIRSQAHGHALPAVPCRPEPRRSAGPQDARGVRQADPGHRPDVPAERRSRRHALHRDRPGPRKDRHHDLTRRGLARRFFERLARPRRHTPETASVAVVGQAER